MFEPRSMVLFAVFGLSALALPWLAAPGPLPAPLPSGAPGLAQEVLLRRGDRIGGEVRARVIRVPTGAVVHAESDLRLEATDTIAIEGELRAIDVEWGSAATDAPKLELVAGNRITVLGTVRGGRGLSHAGQPPALHLLAEGGRGSDVLLHAPDVLVVGLVRSGDGGQGGGGGKGGAGGSIVHHGEILSSHGVGEAVFEVLGHTVTWMGGTGGSGGLPVPDLAPIPGSGGRGGDVHWYPHPLADTFDDPVDLPQCLDGTPGRGGGAAVGGEGGQGVEGLPGTPSNPNGGPGGAGEDGGTVTGKNGKPGNPGGDCCSPPGVGGKGGRGGDGGNATGGKGGKGGKGGDALPGGTGGNGGKGGRGGSAIAGDGGDGGRGGKGLTPGSGGEGGDPGSATPGAPGSGGDPGLGSGAPNGNHGPQGGGGSTTQGTGGNLGVPGTGC